MIDSNGFSLAVHEPKLKVVEEIVIESLKYLRIVDIMDTCVITVVLLP